MGAAVEGSHSEVLRDVWPLSPPNLSHRDLLKPLPLLQGEWLPHQSQGSFPARICPLLLPRCYAVAELDRLHLNSLFSQVMVVRSGFCERGVAAFCAAAHCKSDDSIELLPR